MLIQEDLASLKGRLRLRELVGAGEPLNPYASRGSNPRLARARQACCSLVCGPCPGQAAPPEPAAELLRADRAGR